MAFLGFILHPLVLLLQWALETIHAVVPSYGFSIVLLSVVVRVAMTPITSAARNAEARHSRVLQVMEPELQTIRANSKGRERFERIEGLYQKHHYHPIQSLLSLVPLLLQLPFLLAALLLLTDYPPLEGNTFLIIPDLSEPDGLLPFGVVGAGATINLLPLLLTGVALLESFINPTGTTSTRLRFLVVSLVILLLIYPLPAAVCLYWLTSNCWSLASASLQSRFPINAASNDGEHS